MLNHDDVAFVASWRSLFRFTRGFDLGQRASANRAAKAARFERKIDMDDQQKTFLLLALICATVFFLTRAHAQEPLTTEQPAAAAAAVTEAELPQASQLIRSVVQQLQQAVLQRDFASNADELALLQSAHDTLVAAIKKLCCQERERAAQLASDIEHVLVRDSTYLGPLTSPADERFGPVGPTRDQLAQLAQEGQELLRGAPTIHRLIDSDTFSLTIPSRPAETVRVNEYPISPTYTDSFNLPADEHAATTQFHFRF